MSKALNRWIESELSCPKGEGEGRNNQMIRLAPRMMELGWEEEAIFEKFKDAYELTDDSSRDEEIWRVIRNARKYAREGGPIDDAASRAESLRLVQIRREARRELDRIFDSHRWTLDEIRGLGWCQLPPIEQRRAFLSALFNEDEIIWSGDKFHSGKPRHARHFRTVKEWIGSTLAFPFISHCTFRPGSISRSNDCVSERRYLVIESDHLTHDQVLSLFSWLHHDRGICMRAAVFSGKRSIHGWFDWPSNDLRELSAFVEGLLCDPATLRASQPVRLAGVRRRETGRIQELLYLS